MLSRVFHPWFRLFAGTILVFAGNALVAPAKARASCGDYVTFGGQASSHGRDMRSRPVPTPCHQCPQQSPERGNSPCHGPQCRGGDLPAPTSPTVLERAPDNWAYFDLSDFRNDKRRSNLAWEINLMFPSGFETSIYHPPRF